jgi:hypothetical protein
MNSPEHRANILSTDFTQIGIATAQGIYEGEPTVFVVEEFGTPAPAAAPTPFVDTASAATTPVVATAPVVATPKVTPVVQLPAKTVAAKPVTVPRVTPTVPVVVAMQSSSAPAMQQTFIAVQGGATQTVPAVPTMVPATTSAPSVGATAATTPLPAQSNIVQQLLSDPKSLANDFYLFVMVLFLIALALNIFINIRVQYPKLIAGGLLIIVTAGLCIMLNQNIGFLHTVIL